MSLFGLTHTYPQDLDILLVGPAGQKVMVMSDAGGFGPGISGVTLVFDDDAAAGLLPTTAPTSGLYKPTDFEPGDIMPGPAPAGPYDSKLSVFKGTNPNGTWWLYVADDSPSDVGSMSQWCLNILPSISAGEVTNLQWLDKSTLTWDAGASATSYVVYRGDQSQLLELADQNGDTCLRGTTLTQQFAPVSESPLPGALYWYLVRASNAQGEGPAGFMKLGATTLARIVNSTGTCP